MYRILISFQTRLLINAQCTQVQKPKKTKIVNLNSATYLVQNY